MSFTSRGAGRLVSTAAILALPLVSVLTIGCGSDSGSDSTGLSGGLAPQSGKPSMGRLGKALGVITANPPSIGNGGPPQPPPPPPPPPSRTGAARVKFCHTLTHKKMDVTLEVQIGAQKLMAATGACSTPTGQACLSIPSGRQSLSLSFQGQVLSSTEYDFQDGTEYGVFADVDDQGPYLAGGAMGAALSCAQATTSDVTGLGNATPPKPPMTPPMPPVTPPMPPAAAMCGAATAKTTCSQCTYSMCCTELQACANNPACLAIVDCGSACAAGDQACVRTCISNNPGGVAALNTYLSCTDNKCQAACSSMPGMMPPVTMMPPPVTPPTTPPPAQVTCAGQMANTTCTRCTYGMCCNELQGCVNNQSCLAIVDCAGVCASGDDACLRRCLDANPTGVTPLMAYLDCRTNKCQAACATGTGTGGSPMPMSLGMPAALSALRR